MKSEHRATQLSLFYDGDTFLDERGRKCGKTLREKVREKCSYNAINCIYCNNGDGCLLKEQDMSLVSERSFVEIDLANCGKNCPYYIISKNSK